MRVIAFSFLVFFLNASPVFAADRYVGYYYPIPNNVETYKARMRVLFNASPIVRLNTIERIKKEFRDKSFPSQFAIFAKGKFAEKIIIVSLIRGNLDTIYRARALLESMGKIVHMAPLFRKVKIEEGFNIFDLLKMLGFEQITVSDGEKFSYQVFLN